MKIIQVTRRKWGDGWGWGIGLLGYWVIQEQVI
jgi:hypothetical protein